MGVASYRDLNVWQRAMDLAETCYRVTESFPKQETYGLAIALRRSAVQIPSKIAEGSGRGATHEYIHHLYLARGDLSEFETQILLAERLNYVDHDRVEQILAATSEIGKMLNGLIHSLERRL